MKGLPQIPPSPPLVKGGEKGGHIGPPLQGSQDAVPAWALKLALLRADLVRLFAAAVRGAEAGKVGAAKADFLQTYNLGAWAQLYVELGTLSLATLERWAKAMRKSGDPLDLVPHWGEHRLGKRSVSPEAGQVMLAVALHPNRLHLNEVVRLGRKIMGQRGISDGLSDATYLRFLKDFRDRHYGHWLFHREGEKARNDKCDPYLVRDYDLIKVGDALVADGHVLNFEITNPWTGKPKRMMLITFYDMKSSYPAGWEIMPTENTQAIAVAMRRAILRLGKIPLSAYLDNGKAFGAKFFTGSLAESGIAGLFERLGMATILAWPYHGESKTLERFHKTFGELERLMPTYTGTSIDLKPPRLNRGEKLHGRMHQKITGGVVPTIFQAHRAIGAWFDEYAARPQRGHLNGQCPGEVFEAGRGPGVDEEQLRHLMMSAEIKTIGRNGVRMDGVDYYHSELYGRRQPVLVRFDMVEPDFVLIYEPSGAFICKAEPRPRVHPLARITGTAADRELLAREIGLKRGLAATTMREARKFANEVVIPEAQRLLESQGLAGGDARPTGQGPAKENLLRLPNAEDLEKQVVDAQRRQGKDEAQEAAGFWRRLRELPERDRFERLLELEVQGRELPEEDLAFMRYFEKTETYQGLGEYYEERRLIFSLGGG